MRVLVVHNRYRFEGGEERSVELQAAALRNSGVTHALLERSSSAISRPRAALALLRGGSDEGDVETAAAELEADVAHFHNMLPAFGPGDTSLHGPRVSDRGPLLRAGLRARPFFVGKLCGVRLQRFLFPCSVVLGPLVEVENCSKTSGLRSGARVRRILNS